MANFENIKCEFINCFSVEFCQIVNNNENVWLLVNPWCDAITNIYITRFTIYDIWYERTCAVVISDFSVQFKYTKQQMNCVNKQRLAIKFVDYWYKYRNVITIFW